VRHGGVSSRVGTAFIVTRAPRGLQIADWNQPGPDLATNRPFVHPGLPRNRPDAIPELTRR